MKFNTLVKSVRLYKNLSAEKQAEVTEKRKFVVTTVDSRGGNLESNQEVHSFDYVVVSTGHNSKPHVPEIKGIEKFKGKVITAKNLRALDSDYILDKKILILGGSYSALDLLVQLLENPKLGPQNLKKIVMVGRGVKSFQVCSDFEPYRRCGKLVVVEGEIKEIVKENTIKLTDGSEHEIDTLALCTGYEFNFPFLDLEKDKLIDFNPKAFKGRFISPLYKRFISIREPHFFFIGLLDYSALYHVCDEAQGMLVKAVIDRKYKLPSQEEMYQSFLNDIDRFQYETGKSLAYFFQISPPITDLNYLEDLRNILKDIYPYNVEQGTIFNSSLIRAYKKMLEFIASGNCLSYKSYDFHISFDRTLRNSTDFV